jgi:hypothetical protein
MTATSIHKELLENERQFWQAIKERDSQKLESLTADTYTFVMGEGANTFSRNDFVSMMTSNSFKMLDFDIDLRNATVRELGRDAVAIVFPSHWSFEREGKRDDMESFTTAIWTRDGSRWRCAMDAETVSS